MWFQCSMEVWFSFFSWHCPTLALNMWSISRVTAPPRPHLHANSAPAFLRLALHGCLYLRPPTRPTTSDIFLLFLASRGSWSVPDVSGVSQVRPAPLRRVCPTMASLHSRRCLTADGFCAKAKVQMRMSSQASNTQRARHPHPHAGSFRPVAPTRIAEKDCRTTTQWDKPGRCRPLAG